MDSTDKKIIGLLREDARFRAADIATMLGLEEAEVVKRIADLQNSGVLVKYTAVVNNELADSDYVVALIEVKVTPQTNHGFDAIAREIMNYEEVSGLYLMSGAYDLAVMIEGKSLKSVAGFVSDKLSVMENVISTSTHFILKKYKAEGVVLDKGLVKQREIMA